MRMPSVSFCTYCHKPHLPILHKPGVLKRMVDSHKWPFSEVIVVHQNCRGIAVPPFDFPVRILESEDYHPGILTRFGIPEEDPIARQYTHGEDGAHWWVFHCINLMISAVEAKSEYIVLSDCDCKMIKNEPGTWIEAGIDILQKMPTRVLLISPSDGAGPRYDQTMSQQLFLIRRETFLGIEWSKQWNGKFDAPGGPFAEYYFLAEGRIGRHLTNHNVYRYVLPNNYRYWHTKDFNGD